MTEGIAVHDVDDRMRYELMQHGVLDLDDGERDLLAYAHRERDVWWFWGPDKAVIKALHLIGKLDRAVSLENMIRAISGKTPSLDHSQTESWLSTFRTRLMLDDLE